MESKYLNIFFILYYSEENVALGDIIVTYKVPLQKPTQASSSRRGVTSYDSSGLHLKVL
jgi:hypothetical protein